MVFVYSGKIFVLVQQGQELGYRNSKITFKEEIMTAEQKKKCHAIIHAASVAAGGAGAGMAQIPGSDNAAEKAVILFPAEYSYLPMPPYPLRDNLC